MKNAKALLAIDPFENDLKPTKEALWWFKQWLQDTKSTLTVAYVLPLAKNFASIEAHNLADKALKQYVADLDLHIPVQTTVLAEAGASNRVSIKKIIQYAQKISAETILLTSFGRRIVGRLLLGSFADRLLTESPIPLLFLNASPTKHPMHKPVIRKVLFPTDFSQASRRAFELFLEQFQSIALEVVLFHVSMPVTITYEYGLLGPAINIPDGYWEDLTHFIQNESENWVRYAHQKGFIATFSLKEGHENIVGAINTEAENENVALIALASTNLQNRAKVLGSIAAQLFYQRRYPIWICGPEAIKGELTKIKYKTHPSETSISAFK